MNVSKTGQVSLDYKTDTNRVRPASIGFAILIILGLGGLVAAGIGVCGALQLGHLSNLGLNNSIIMILSGVSVGFPLLIVGGIGLDATHSHNKLAQSPTPIEESNQIIEINQDFPEDEQSTSSAQGSSKIEEKIEEPKDKQTIEIDPPPEPKRERYLWNFREKNNKCCIPCGQILAIDVDAAATVRYTFDNWVTHANIDTSASVGTYAHRVELPTTEAHAGKNVVFTFYWHEARRWEGVNFTVKVFPSRCNK